jgi:hypothetical protein
MASQQKAADCAICDQHFESPIALAHHIRGSAEHARKLREKLAMLRRTFECGSCYRCFGSAEALTEHKIDSERLAKERAQGGELDPQTLKALTELKRNFERLEAERAQQKASDNELSLQALSLQTPTDDKPWSTCPELHESVVQCLGGNGLSISFYEEGEVEDSIRDYDTNIMGAFICPNRSCRTEKWTSMKVAISIRLFADQQYNATVWHQRCRQCESMGVLRVDEESYTNRVAYRLRTWLGLEREDPIFSKTGDRPPDAQQRVLDDSGQMNFNNANEVHDHLATRWAQNEVYRLACKNEDEMGWMNSERRTVLPLAGYQKRS